jgi:hypothetical protein
MINIDEQKKCVDPSEFQDLLETEGIYSSAVTKPLLPFTPSEVAWLPII